MVDRFPDRFAGKVLDVGCSRKMLAEVRPDLDYLGIDMSDTADLQVDLDTGQPLPFEDASFDLVVCTDVLEHINPLHHVFDELVRVSRRHLIVSLPNCWRNLRRRINRGTGTPQYYGLPVEAPADRHKWFMHAHDIADFYRGMAKKHGLSLDELVINVKPSGANALRRLRYPDARRFDNRYAHSVWGVFEKPAGDA